MKAIWIENFGGVENLEIRDVENPPAPKGTEILVRVKAAGINRADILQRRGHYPPPAGVSPNIPGLEFAGEIAEKGSEVSKFKTGERVFGITAGVAQAEFLLTDEALVAKIPERFKFTEAAAIPEAFITANDALFTQANLRSGETLLIHAVGSGVGLAALELAKAKQIRVFGTSRSSEKLQKCIEMGLDFALHVDEQTDFSKIILEEELRGVDVILDLVGGGYFEMNLLSLASKGRLVLVGLTGGRKTEFDLAIALSKRLTIIGTVMRSRSMMEKAEATRKFTEDVLPLLDSGKIKPILDLVFHYTQIREAHEFVEANNNFGKVVLEF